MRNQFAACWSFHDRRYLPPAAERQDILKAAGIIGEAKNDPKNRRKTHVVKGTDWKCQRCGFVVQSTEGLHKTSFQRQVREHTRLHGMPLEGQTWVPHALTAAKQENKWMRLRRQELFLAARPEGACEPILTRGVSLETEPIGEVKRRFRCSRCTSRCPDGRQAAMVMPGWLARGGERFNREGGWGQVAIRACPCLQPDAAKRQQIQEALTETLKQVDTQVHEEHRTRQKARRFEIRHRAAGAFFG